MKLHEYQAKEIFKNFGIPVPEGMVIENARVIRQVTKRLPGNRWVVKAQVYAGARGKGGGVKIVEGEAALKSEVEAMLGTRLVTPQTDNRGLPVNAVLIEQPSDIAQEYYMAVTLDRTNECLSVIASACGGMDIEEVAANEPEKIVQITIYPVTGINAFQCRRIAYGLGVPAADVKALMNIVNQLYRLAVEKDVQLVEVNPLVRLNDGGFVALDAKLVVDDNALFRHADLLKLHDPRQEDEKEMQAQQHDLSYVALRGNIGCMVNGAGLAMATMDLIKVHGGEPANFLDVGGTATADRVAHALKIILSDPNVKAILVNIFGGIVRCDLIAEGILQAVAEVGITLPVVVRLEGTHAEKGRVLLKSRMENIQAAESLADAATKAVTAARGA